MTSREALSALLEEARTRGDYAALLEALPYARRMGFRAEPNEKGLRIHLPFRQELVGNPMGPYVHGGVLGACLELSALLGLMHAGAASFPRTIDFTVDYLRTATTADCHAQAEIVRTGRRVANARMTCWQADPAKPVAVGRGNFQVI